MSDYERFIKLTSRRSEPMHVCVPIPHERPRTRSGNTQYKPFYKSLGKTRNKRP